MIPITVVTGFLGSGKTSLIAHLLDTAGDRRIAVIVNDLAAESIDTAFLHGGEHISMKESDLIRTIAGGRIGAGKRKDLEQTIQELAEHSRPPEAIVIETSGSSPVLELSNRLYRHNKLKEKVYLDTVIAMVDTTTFGTYWKDTQLQPLLADQLAAADLIVLNKFDRAGFFQRLSGRRLVGKVNPGARLGTADFGRLPVEEIIATGRRPGQTETASAPTPSSQERSIAPSNPAFHPLVARFLNEDRPFHPERLDRWLNTEWPGIIRIKGFVWLASDMEHVYVVDMAGPQREMGMEGTWYAAVPPEEVPDDPIIKEALAEGAFGDRRQAITVIGVPDAVERELRNLRQCLLSRTELDRGPRGWGQLDDPIARRFAASEVEASEAAASAAEETTEV
jgi:G3E family GTPase